MANDPTANFQPPVINTFQVIDIINAAYRYAGALQYAGRAVSNSEAQEGLNVCNAMIDGWKIEELLIICYLRQLFSFQNGVKDYSVGPNGDFNIERPEKIHGAGFVINPGQQTETEIPMEIVFTFQQYQNLVAKNITTTLPLVMYYRATIPLGTATFWPVPQNATCSVALYTQAAFQEFSTINDTLIAPKGYREMLIFNLAWRIHSMPPYNKLQMDPTVIEMAKFYKERVKFQQMTPIYIASDPGAMQQNGGERDCSSFPKAWVPYYY
jgi:hypothetical protein